MKFTPYALVPGQGTKKIVPRLKTAHMQLIFPKVSIQVYFVTLHSPNTQH